MASLINDSSNSGGRLNRSRRKMKEVEIVMASIACNQCPKSFRNESGLSWHITRVHGGESEYGSVAHVQGPETENNLDAPSARLDSGEETTGVLSGLAREVSHIQDSLELAIGSIETISDGHSSLKSVVQQLESKVISLGGLQKGLEAVKTQADSQEQNLAHLSEAVLALCRLLWELDTSHKDRRYFSDLAVNVSPEDRTSARDVLRKRLSSYRGEHLVDAVGSGQRSERRQG